MQYHRIFSLTNSDSQILHGHDWIIATLYLSLKIHVVFEFNECQSFTEFWNRIPLYMLVMMNKLERIFFFTTEHIPHIQAKGRLWSKSICVHASVYLCNEGKLSEKYRQTQMRSIGVSRNYQIRCWWSIEPQHWISALFFSGHLEIFQNINRKAAAFMRCQKIMWCKTVHVM